MKIQRLFLLSFVLLLAQVADAQRILDGLVLDRETLEPIIGATVSDGAPSVGSRSQSISGGGSVKDIKTMFELTYLYFTQPRRDTTAFRSLYNRTHSFLSNRNASPRVDYNDSIRAVLYGHHPRMEPVTQAVIEKADYDRIFQIYKERFSDASNFTTVIVGNVSFDQLRPLLCQYLATLPSTPLKAPSTTLTSSPLLK